MARPQKEGLDYFPVDVDMCSDDKIYMLEVECGLEGLALFVKLLMKIYDNSYYVKWIDKDTKIFAHKNSVGVNVVNNLIECCLDNNLFNKSIYKEYEVLTSEAIQKRYFKATSRRKEVKYRSELMLADVNDYNNLVNVNINSTKKGSCGVDDDKSTQSKVKESKVKDKECSSDIKFGENSKSYKYAKKLRKLILQNNDRQPVPNETPKDLESWCMALDRLNRLGPKGAKDKGYSWEEIDKIIEWCQQDDFWWKNILSATKLRKQVIKLENQMKKDNKSSQKSNKDKLKGFTIAN